MTKYTEATRKTVVTSIHGPLHQVHSSEEGVDELWWAWMGTRSGMLPETITRWGFFSENDAVEFVNKHTVGAEIDKLTMQNLETRFPEYIKVRIDDLKVPDAVHAGDEASPLAFNVLKMAGLSDGLSASGKVIDFLGLQRIGEIKKRHGENWRFVAMYEYCWLNLPTSSPAYIAAAYQFHWYITHDEFSAGYFWRDLEIIVSGTEATALKSIEMRKNAGAAGSKKSAKAREERRRHLMRSMEAVSERNPDVMKLGAKIVADLALSLCVGEAPVLWAQGQGQVDEYLGEMRRGEAGEELQSRFVTLFSAKPLRRFSNH